MHLPPAPRRKANNALTEGHLTVPGQHLTCLAQEAFWVRHFLRVSMTAPAAFGRFRPLAAPVAPNIAEAAGYPDIDSHNGEQKLNGRSGVHSADMAHPRATINEERALC